MLLVLNFGELKYEFLIGQSHLRLKSRVSESSLRIYHKKNSKAEAASNDFASLCFLKTGCLFLLHTQYQRSTGTGTKKPGTFPGTFPGHLPGAPSREPKFSKKSGTGGNRESKILNNREPGSRERVGTRHRFSSLHTSTFFQIIDNEIK